ncbi:Rrf2 family transcriptional regulator [Mesorhizobium sp. 10J20-29]
MKRNSRLSSMLHILVHMAPSRDEAMTSEQLAGFVHTNAVVIRRAFAGLREAGIVASARGHGGGWQLAKAPETISLAEICTALGESLLPFGTEPEAPGCLVEQAVIGALDEFRRDAEKLLAEKLSRVSLADIAATVGPNMQLTGAHNNAS